MYMKMKKMLAVGLTCSLSATLAAGCSGAGKTSDKSSDSGVTHLEFFSSKMENVSTMQKLADKFNSQNTDVQVTLNSPADAGTVLKTRMTKDDLPDIIAYGGDNTYTELTEAGILLDLSDQ